MTKKSKAKAVADFLGIPSVEGKAGPWMSSEGTVLEVWVRAVSERLDVPYTNKVDTMAAMVQRVGEIWDANTMASQNTPSKGGGNIAALGFPRTWPGPRPT